MTDALDQTARSALERFIQRARGLLEDDLARHAEGRFGIHATDGTIEDEDGLHLSPDDLAARRDIVDVLHFIRREEPDHPAAVSRLIREAAFTHLNRLVAIRIAETIGLLPESIAQGPASAGYRELLEVAPLLAHDASGGYWRYLQLCGDELAADLPQLFDPRNPLLELSPSPAAFDELIDLLTDAELTPVWDAPDALGWACQFFNSGDERRAMRDASPSPRNSRELAVRNQFFTPRYVVDFLVHNSLGRRLLDADPTSALIDDLPLLLDAPTEPGEPLDLAEVRVLDPACGSGHFLLGAYDVLEHAWRHAGVEPDDAAPRIVASLWGIDIDPRCAQVAAAAIILRARRACPRHDLPTPNIICARALPEPAGGWEALLASLAEDRRQLVAAMRDALARAPLLGPLLKVEEHLATEIRARVAGADDTDGTLFAAAGVASDAFGHAEADVLAVLREVADQTTSTPAERVFAAEANDAIRFVEALRHRYDTVLMNPPFGEPVTATKDYLKAAYTWAPSKDTNLLALFVGRGIELCKPTGATGAITSRACMFLKTFEDFRTQVLLGYRMHALADLGYGVMEQALVEAAAYVLDARRSGDTETTTFVRLLKDTNRAGALRDAITNDRAGTQDERVLRVAKHDLTAIPGAPLAYWIGDSIRRLFTDLPPLEGNGAEARQGLATGDDFRFLRLAWEVDPAKIAHSRDETRAGKRWVPFAKGGEYSPFWSDVHLLVDWANDGETLRSYPGARPQNVQYYFRPGLTWPRRTNSGFGLRALPSGSAFGDKGPAVFALDNSTEVVLAWLTSRVVQALIDSLVAAGEEVTSGGASRSYEVGLVQKLPWPGALLAASNVAELTTEVVALRGELDLRDETTGSFVSPFLPAPHQRLADAVGARVVADEDRSLAILERTSSTDEQIAEAVGLDDAGRRYLDDEIGPHPTTYPDAAVDPDRFARLYRGRIEDTIDELIAERGGSRAIANLTYFADRRLEVLSHGLQVSPAALVAERRRQGLLPREEPARTASDLLSYLVGVAFGRWDVRFALAPSSPPSPGDPFDARPACSLGMLVRGDGMPVDATPDGYPVRIPPHGVLLDESGHARDIAAAVEHVTQLVSDDADEFLADILGALDSQELRAHLRSRFFKEHVARYSKSRRKAPIYWPLYVPSGNWGVWVYAPRLTRETLYVVASEALRREGHTAVEIERLGRERAVGGGRGAKALDKALDDERKLAEELRRFRQEADRIAGLGWEPDLDDGIVLCAAPLADLFPQWRKELAGYRDELRAGKYEWSTVSKWAEQL
jgi:predicted RNA methylase